MNKPTKVLTHTAVSSRTHTAQDVDVWHKPRWPGFTSKMTETGLGEIVWTKNNFDK